MSETQDIEKEVVAKRTYSFFPKTLAHCVEKVTRPVLKTQGLAGSRILTEWQHIVGSVLATHAAPEKLSFPKGKKTDGTLTISVESGFATELQHMQPVILERLAAYFGYRAVVRIAIAHTWLPPVAKSQPAPLKPTLSPSAGNLADDVDDPELKAALKSLAQTLSGQS